MSAANADSKELTIVIIGVVGVGKSSLGSVLLGYKPDDFRAPFTSDSATHSCTTRTIAVSGGYLGHSQRQIQVIDTQGHGDSDGRDPQFRRQMMEELQKLENVHAIIWVISSEKCRVDKQDMEFLKIVKEVFGEGFVKNLIINFSRFRHSWEAEAVRRKQRTSFLKMKEGINELLTGGLSREAEIFVPQVPYFAVDALYFEEDPVQKQTFQQETEKLWNALEHLRAYPLKHLKRIQSEIQTFELRRSHDPDSWTEKEEEELCSLKQQEKRQNSVPLWGWVVFGVLGIAAGTMVGAAIGGVIGAVAVASYINNHFREAAEEAEHDGQTARAWEFRTVQGAIQQFLAQASQDENVKEKQV